MNKEEIELNDDQKQVILGTLLGNSQLVQDKVGICLLMRSSSKEWLDAKADSLECIHRKRWKKKANYYWQSKYLTYFDKIYPGWYRDGEKSITMKHLNLMTPIGLSVWWGDLSCLVGKSRLNICLRTQNLREGAKIVHKFFNEISIPCNLNVVRGKNVVVFTVEGTKKFLNLIGQHLHPSRYHLIPRY